MKCAQKGLKKCDYSIYMIYIQGMEKVNLIKRSSELYEFIDRVLIEIHEIHTDLNDATHGFTCNLS